MKDPETAPTAIVCANGEMAVVAMRQARRLGFRVPRDLSVVGFSNETFTQVSDPPLTVV
ncbi:MAG: substrate-binding domain-containing protein, partial [Planctomycetales bacterium]|nr:substrate-binding domain-containing protein [Planctomycetales bacterium]